MLNYIIVGSFLCLTGVKCCVNEELQDMTSLEETSYPPKKKYTAKQAWEFDECFEGEQQFLFFSEGEFRHQLECRKDSNLQGWTHPLNAQASVTLSGLTKFSNVSINIDSLTVAINSTVQLCSTFVHVNNRNRISFHASGVFIDSNHILTARHNTYQCIMHKSKYSGYRGCYKEEFNNENRFVLETIRVSSNSRDCQSPEIVFDIKRASYLYNESGRDYYGPNHNYLSSNDMAILKTPYPRQCGSHLGLQIENTNIESNKKRDILNFGTIMMTGYGIPLLFGNDTFQLYNSKDTVVSGYDIMKYFGTDTKTFSISDYKDYEFAPISDMIYHHLPDWKSFSGSPIFLVDETGKLNLFAVAIGGFHEWNVGIVINHPLIKDHVQQLNKEATANGEARTLKQCCGI